jgi:hypothetical protein
MGRCPGRTVCAADCLGTGILIARGKPESQGEPPELPGSVYFDEADCGGTFDGFSASNDADSGL